MITFDTPKVIAKYKLSRYPDRHLYYQPQQDKMEKKETTHLNTKHDTLIMINIITFSLVFWLFFFLYSIPAFYPCFVTVPLMNVFYLSSKNIAFKYTFIILFSNYSSRYQQKLPIIR